MAKISATEGISLFIVLDIKFNWYAHDLVLFHLFSIDLHSLLKDLRGDMILAVKSDMKWLADELHKKDVSFLNDEQYEEVTESNSKSKDSKARIVVEAVLNKVKQDDKNLEVFVDILKRNSQMFKALLEKLDNCE